MRQRPGHFFERTVSAQHNHGADIPGPRASDLGRMTGAFSPDFFHGRASRLEHATRDGHHAGRAPGGRIHDQEVRSAQKLHSRNRSIPYCGGRLPIDESPG